MEELRGLLFGPDGARLDLILGALGSLLAAPGQLLLQLFPSPDSDEVYVTRMRDLALPLGIACWLVMAFVARMIWIVRRQPRHVPLRGERVTRAVLAAVGEVATTVVRWTRAVSERWTARDWLGAAWRAEAVHLALFLALPLTLEAMRVLMFVLTLPFSALGGYKGETWMGAVRHLHHPVCLLFISTCRSPSHGFRSPTSDEVAQCRAGPCPPESTWLVDPYWWLWKATWAILTFAWVRCWRTRERQPLQRPAG